MTYRKIGGLHFITIGPMGLTFYRRRWIRQPLPPTWFIGLLCTGAAQLLERFL